MHAAYAGQDSSQRLLEAGTRLYRWTVRRRSLAEYADAVLVAFAWLGMAWLLAAGVERYWQPILVALAVVVGALGTLAAAGIGLLIAAFLVAVFVVLAVFFLTLVLHFVASILGLYR